MMNVVVISTSVTRLGDLMHLGQLFKTCGNNYLPKLLTFLDNFGKGGKIL